LVEGSSSVYAEYANAEKKKIKVSFGCNNIRII